MDRKKAETVKLKENLDKILFAISYVIKTANDEGKRPTQYEIVKTIFLADRSHLNEWGRPITYDNYVAMKHGPVPSLVYDALKETAVALRKFKTTKFPWKREQVSQNVFQYTIENDLPFADVLSKSDMQSLGALYASVSKLGFYQVRKLTHEDPAYLDAWDDESQQKQFPMSLALFFDSPNFDEAKRISEQSNYV